MSQTLKLTFPSKIYGTFGLSYHGIILSYYDCICYYVMCFCHKVICAFIMILCTLVLMQWALVIMLCAFVITWYAFVVMWCAFITTRCDFVMMLNGMQEIQMNSLMLITWHLLFQTIQHPLVTLERKARGTGDLI